MSKFLDWIHVNRPLNGFWRPCRGLSRLERRLAPSGRGKIDLEGDSYNLTRGTGAVVTFIWKCGGVNIKSGIFAHVFIDTANHLIY